MQSKRVFFSILAVIVVSIAVGVILGLHSPSTPSVQLETKLRPLQDNQILIRGNHRTSFPSSGQSPINTSCQTDADCRLVHTKHSFSCCWEGACEPIDYSQSEWIAVNAGWYSEARDGLCPSDSISEATCGPAPSCATTIVNDRFVARCTDQVCSKVAE